jgi:hypothetical protein
MKSKEILDANPKAASLIHDYYLNKMLDALEDDKLPENFKDFAREKGLPFENIVAMLEVNPRQLFDFFDDQGIFINISTTNNGKTYHCDVSQDLKGESQGGYTRKEADLKGVILAIEMLEKKLNSLEETNKES